MIHPVAWLIWLGAALAVLTTTRNPFYLALTMAAIATVLRYLRSHAGDVRAAPLTPLRFALIVLPLAALFNALTVHVGHTVLLRLPAAWPLLGGPITLEALTFGALNGLALVGIYTTFVALGYAVTVRALIGLIPRAFFPVAVVTSIALTFVPVTLRHWHQIRDAQAIRGHRIRGLRDYLPLFLPLLIGGLEHAFQLAEAMMARGFAIASETSAARRARMIIASGLFMLLVGWLLRLAWGQHTLGTPLMALGGSQVVVALWWLGRQMPRTTYRHTPWHSRDYAIALAGALAVAAFVVKWPGLDRSSIFFYPYPALSIPSFNAWLALALVGLWTPVMILPFAQCIPFAQHRMRDGTAARWDDTRMERTAEVHAMPATPGVAAHAVLARSLEATPSPFEAGEPQ
ncbi:MAG: energy-coupling factor transporter transmembrane component T [Anaerolineae bacterium]